MTEQNTRPSINGERPSGGVVIVGGGLAGQRCCETLRSRGFEGRIRIVADEPRPPYDRPPLSKAVLAGERSPDSLSFRSPAWYAEKEVELLTGDPAVALDPEIKTVTLGSGAILAYDQVLVATGSRPRPLPGTESFANAHLLRTAEDAMRLRDALSPGARLVVVGAGFIGLEVAATARRLGCQVTVLEAAPSALGRVLVPELADWFVDLHRAEGVDIRFSAHVARFGESGGGVDWVQLTDGSRFECDALVLGIGIEPATEWLEGSGLEVDGVRVDTCGRTSATDVFAAGDSCRVFNPVSGRHERSEHWGAAARQGAQVARGILGIEPLPPALPSFWTDQFGHRIQLVGNAAEGDETVIAGDPGAAEFTALLKREGTAVAAMAVDQPRSIPALRRQIEQSTVQDEERIDSELRTAN
ncbi:MAG: NAD(P)/FAD-dependent oxidoreductase [Solirubrobacterales bacterium]